MTAPAHSDPTAQDEARFALQPLLDALPIDNTRRDAGGDGVIVQAAAMLDVSARSLQRLRHTGLTPWTADRLAIAAGLHPLLVWGKAWLDAIDPEAPDSARDTASRYEALSPGG